MQQACMEYSPLCQVYSHLLSPSIMMLTRIEASEVTTLNAGTDVHRVLVHSQVCPLHPGEDWQEDKKLNLILSKVQEHQQSLRENGSMTPSIGKPKTTFPTGLMLPCLRFTLKHRSLSSKG